jgi:glutathione synthase/RimK-type ligase-like ATP-grasp enzyme
MIWLATCKELPEPDFDELPLLRALKEAGLTARVAAWDDPTVPWHEAEIVLIRSTWNYHQKVGSFLGWIESVSTTCRLINPGEVIKWNHHKGYLLELEKAGIPVAPTALVRKGERTQLAEIMEHAGWKEVVIKPAVSGGSFRTLKNPGNAAGESHLAALLRDADALVQSYLPSVEDRGERSMIFIDGELTHAVRKSPRFQGDDEETVPVEPSVSERQFAESVLEACPFRLQDLVYARVDIAPNEAGRLVVMELELIEPSLFLTWGAHNTAASAAGLMRLVNRIKREANSGQ